MQPPPVNPHQASQSIERLRSPRSPAGSEPSPVSNGFGSPELRSVRCRSASASAALPRERSASINSSRPTAVSACVGPKRD
eukprot:14597809-Alexandrium_andersonii.AAC.1